MSHAVNDPTSILSTDTSTTQDVITVTSTSSSSSSSQKSSSVFAALTRALFMSLAFLFKRPIRLFRPVKISTWTGLQAVAEEQGRKVTPAFVRALVRKEGWSFFPRHILPPLLANSCIGLTLFGVYTTSESYLHAHHSFSTSFPSTLVIPFISGSLAGAAQTIISAPLDNARLLLLRRQRHLRLYGHRYPAREGASKPFNGWWSLLRDAVFLHTGTSQTGRAKIRRGYSLWTLSLLKDAIGFGTFFAVFEIGRTTARRVGLMWDGIEEGEEVEENDWDDERNEPLPSTTMTTNKKRRSATSLVVQSLGILTAGGIAGLCFALVARPFDRMRMTIYEGRSTWLRKQELRKLAETASAHRGSVKVAARVEELNTIQSKARAPRSTRLVKKEQVRTVRTRGTSRLGSFSANASLARPHTPQHSFVPPIQTVNSIAVESMPSALSLISNAAQRVGPFNFFFGSTSALRGSSATQRIVGIGRGVDGTSPPPSRLPRLRFGPTRLSARGRQAKAVLETGKKGVWARGARVLAYVPPYAVGFFAYALMSGDLK